MTPGSEPTRLALPAVLDLKAAGPLAAALNELRGRDVTLDASQVARFGSLCLQVLLSAHATWTADGRAFAFANPSPEFAEGLAMLGAAGLPIISVIEDFRP